MAIIPSHLINYHVNLFLLQTLRGHVGSITALGTDPKGQTLFSGGADAFIRFWEIKTGRIIRVNNTKITYSYKIDKINKIYKKAYISIAIL